MVLAPKVRTVSESVGPCDEAAHFQPPEELRAARGLPSARVLDHCCGGPLQSCIVPPRLRQNTAQVGPCPRLECAKEAGFYLGSNFAVKVTVAPGRLCPSVLCDRCAARRAGRTNPCSLQLRRGRRSAAPPWGRLPGQINYQCVYTKLLLCPVSLLPPHQPGDRPPNVPLDPGSGLLSLSTIDSALIRQCAHLHYSSIPAINARCVRSLHFTELHHMHEQQQEWLDSTWDA